AVPRRGRVRRPGRGTRAGRTAGARRGRPALGRPVEPGDAGRAGRPAGRPAGGDHRVLRPGPGRGRPGAAGNPLFVTELLGALAQEQMITISDGRAEVSGLTLPPTLRLTILRRISFLAGGTMEALRFASVLGTGFTLTDLAEVTGRSA